MILRSAWALVLCAGPLAAQDRACITRVNHQDIVIAPGAIVADPEVGLRERLWTLPNLTWNRLWGTPAPCDSATTLAFVSGILGYGETHGFCLNVEDSEGFLLVPGARNFRGLCRRTVCDRVNLIAAEAGAVLGRMTEIVTGREVETAQDGLRALASGTGAMLLSGNGPAMVEVLGQTGAGLGAALSAPGVAAATAVTVLTVSGAVYVCAE
jgi:hypothetical protein